MDGEAVAEMFLHEAAIDAGELTPIDGGWHIKFTADGRHCIDVLQMLVNYRVVLSDHEHRYYDHGWCYFGHGVDAHGRARTMEGAFVAAVLAARAWDGRGAPSGFDKQAI